jgi:hypothetical protein
MFMFQPLWEDLKIELKPAEGLTTQNQIKNATHIQDETNKKSW